MVHFQSFAILAVSLASYVSNAYAHAAISPMLGVSGTPVRKDVQFPLENVAPCGRVNAAENLDTSTPVQMAADGTVTMTITNFNPTVDGSRKVKTALVDTTGTGKSFNVEATMTQNGDPNPLTNDSEQIVASMPAGTQCTGGASGNLCLMSMKTTFGFGNCVVVQQAAGSSNSTADSANSTAASDTTSASTDSTATDAGSASTVTEAGTASAATESGAAAAAVGTAAPATQDNIPQGNKGGLAGAFAKVKGLKNIAGTRAARAFKDGIEGRSIRDEKRSGWFWA